MAVAARNGGRADAAAEEYVDYTPRELPAFPPTWINPEIWHHNGAGRLGDQFGETAFDLDPRRRVSCAPAGGSPRMDDATYPGFMTPRTLDL